jgi:hypothetical protein
MAERAEPVLFFVKLAGARALLVFPTKYPSRFENADLCESRPDYNFTITMNRGQSIVVAASGGSANRGIRCGSDRPLASLSGRQC